MKVNNVHGTGHCLVCLMTILPVGKWRESFC